MLQQRGGREAFGGHVLMVQLFAEEDELCLLVIGNTVAEGGGQLAGLGLVAVPPAVAAAVIERGAVAFIKKAKGIASLPVEKFLCIALGANEDKGNGFVPDKAHAAPAGGHGVAFLLTAGGDEHPLLTDFCEGVEGELLPVHFMKACHIAGPPCFRLFRGFRFVPR